MAQGSTARKPVGQQLAYLRKTVTVDTTLDSNNRVSMGYVPAGAKIHSLSYGTRTAWDGTSPVLTVGGNGTTANDIAGSGDIAEQTTSSALITKGHKVVFSSDTEIFAKFVEGTTTAATQGATDLILAYAVDNEGE